MNTSVNKYSKSQPKAGKYLLRQQNESCIKLCTCSKKNAATLSKQTGMERTATKWMGTSRITTKKRCSRITQSVRKFLWTTNADNCFKLLSKFPDCTLQVLTLFVAQYPPRCYCIVRCIDFVQFRVKQPVHYKLVMKTYEVSCCFI